MAVSSADPTMSRNPHPEVHISCRPFSSQASKQSGLMRVLHRWNLNRWHIRAPPGHYKVKSSIFLFCTNALLCMIFPLSFSCFGGRCYKKAWCKDVCLLAYLSPLLQPYLGIPIDGFSPWEIETQQSRNSGKGPIQRIQGPRIETCGPLLGVHR